MCGLEVSHVMPCLHGRTRHTVNEFSQGQLVGMCVCLEKKGVGYSMIKNGGAESKESVRSNKGKTSQW